MPANIIKTTRRCQWGYSPPRYLAHWCLESKHL